MHHVVFGSLEGPVRLRHDLQPRHDFHFAPDDRLAARSLRGAAAVASRACSSASERPYKPALNVGEPRTVGLHPLDRRKLQDVPLPVSCLAIHDARTVHEAERRVVAHRPCVRHRRDPPSGLRSSTPASCSGRSTAATTSSRDKSGVTASTMTANYIITVMLSRQWRSMDSSDGANPSRSSGSTRCFWVGGERAQLAGAERSVLMRPAAVGDRLLDRDVRCHELLDRSLHEVRQRGTLSVVICSSPRFHVLLNFRQVAELGFDLDPHVEDIRRKQIRRARIRHHALQDGDSCLPRCSVRARARPSAAVCHH